MHAWKLSFGIFGVGSFAWKLLLGIFRFVAQDFWLKICSLAFLAQDPRDKFIMGVVIYSSRLKKWCVKESLVFKTLA